jgi:hypothetical protein
MRKRLITLTPEDIRTRGEDWLSVERAAMVEVTSEDEGYPVESTFNGIQRHSYRNVMRQVEYEVFKRVKGRCSMFEAQLFFCARRLPIRPTWH